MATGYEGKAHRGAVKTINHLKRFHIEGMRVMDIGANEGYVSAFLAERGAELVTGFEPHPIAFAKASARVAEFGDRVHLHNVGVMTEAGTMQLSISERDAEADYHCNATTVAPGTPVRPDRRYVEVRMASWSGAVRVAQPTAIKIDTEGSEYDMLLRNTVPDDVQWMCVEFHSTNGIGCPLFAAVATRLMSQGFGVVDLAPSLTKAGSFATRWGYTEVDFRKDHPTSDRMREWIASITDIHSHADHRAPRIVNPAYRALYYLAYPQHPAPLTSPSE